MSARMRTTVAGGAVIMLLGGTSAVPAQADTVATITSGASAYAAAAGTGTSTLSANLQLSGSLGKLLDPLISPIVSTDLDPLLSAIQGSVNSVVAGALGASSSYNATTNASEPQASTAPTGTFPADPLPSSCPTSASQPCYSAVGGNVSVPPLVTAQIGALGGYVEQVASSADATNPVFGRAGAASASVSVLPGISTLLPALPNVGNPLISAAAVSAKANCPNDGLAGASKPKTAPSALVSASGVTLLGGLISLGVDSTSGRIINLTVNNVSYGDVLNLPTVSVAGITVSPFGGSVLVSIPISLSQILAGLGITGSVASALSGLGLTSTLALKLVIGPNTTLTSRTAAAWGLGIGVDLSGSLTFNLLNLVTASVNVPSGIAGGNYGNLLDLRLAYATCQSGVVTGGGGSGGGGSGGSSTPAIPPALV